ncbi:MAG: helix-turn-helix transcriptional regulator [Clostridiales bacterium]|nr:helix-turn-helix transcriptional regulator [Clostridiales bacterium]
MRFEKIRNLREDHDYTQEEIAKILFVSQATYSDYESGKINIPIEAFIRLAQFYGTSIDYLVGLTEEEKD